jgi:hypothetical protein
MVQKPRATTEVPLVFAQCTERNERICSLLSAVIMRRIRSDFHKAIQDTFRSSIEASHIATQVAASSVDGRNGSCKHRTPFVVLVQCCSDLDSDMARTLKDTLQVAAMVSAEVLVDRGNDPTAYLDQILTTLHPETPVFVVALFSAAEMTQASFATTPRSDAGLAGIMLVHPTNDTSRAARIDTAVPTLTVNHQLGSGELLRDVGHCPNQILVSMPRRLERCDPPERLWVARTMLKFINAVLNTMPSDAVSITIETNTGSSPARKAVKFNSRL